jgi:hypothetical protein
MLRIPGLTAGFAYAAPGTLYPLTLDVKHPEFDQFTSMPIPSGISPCSHSPRDDIIEEIKTHPAQNQPTPCYPSAREDVQQQSARISAVPLDDAQSHHR